ncbi:peptide/nickel transport system substrate-binding protein [Antricoccus suffuscus]|uniref:Peptide/nickel transport system substrate-binding protein n=2 Tax=Antricoccus suffuscus TaxID=1629062 RepID=A0A2T0ZTM6_9ACTN|nr:peptide/nickel transport system substrate-binding protein [Antricoccus suffuscus]
MQSSLNCISSSVYGRATLSKVIGIHRGGALVALLVTVILVLTACSGNGSSESKGEGSTLKLLLPFLADTWDTRDTSSVELAPGLLVNEPLMTYQADGTFAPTLAVKVDHPDPLTYVYTLRTGVKFSDGAKLTPEDVKYSFDLHIAKGTTSKIARYWAGKTVSVEGADQVKVTLPGPDPEFPYTITKTGIVEKAYYEKNNGQVGTPNVPQIGTGPYTYESFSAGTSVTLERNSGYWGKEAPYKSISFVTPKDDGSRLLALQSGDYDGIFLPPLSQVPAIKAVQGLSSVKTSDVAIYRISFDMKKAPFDDVHVRKAITHLVDRESLIKTAFGGEATIANSLVPKETLIGLADAAPVDSAYKKFGSELTYDLSAAKAELAQSSVPSGFDVEVPVHASDPTESLIAQTLAQSLKQIGINVSVKSVDDATFGNAVYLDHTTGGLMVDSWNAGSPEPGNLPFSVLTPGSIANLSQLDDPAVNEALKAYRNLEPGTEAQTKLLDALTAAQSQAAYVPIAFSNIYTFAIDSLQVKDFTSFWWLTPIIETLVSK